MCSLSFNHKKDEETENEDHYENIYRTYIGERSATAPRLVRGPAGGAAGGKKNYGIFALFLFVIGSQMATSRT